MVPEVASSTTVLSVTERLLQYGGLGIAIIILLVGIIHLYRRNQQISDARLADAKLTADQYRGALAESTKTTDALTHAVERLLK